MDEGIDFLFRNNMKSRSLRKRFFANTVVVAIAVMLAAALVVDVTYREELEKSTREKLRLHIFNLLSVAETEGSELFIPTILYNPRFNTIDSGLWALALNEQEQPVWQSLSIETIPQALKLSAETGAWHYDKATINNQTFFTAAYKIAWKDNERRYTYHFISAEDESMVSDVILRFRIWLLGGFFFITVILLSCLMLVLHLAFRPISRLEDEITLLEQGKQRSLSADYPKEIRGVTQNLNALIDKEHKQRERYRAGMADLAHSLKTPMAIINSEITNHADNEVLKNAVKRIDKSIEYQLRRAVISGHTLLSYGTDIRNVLDLVVEALEKIYSDKNISVNTRVDEELIFFGDENDLMEVFGNLLDNAHKYAKSKINITVTQNDQTLSIVIEDDGKGLSEDDALKIFSRGERLDRQGLGQGIGLAVVVNIVNSYEGEIKAQRSDLGGAKFEIIFPLRSSLG